MIAKLSHVPEKLNNEHKYRNGKRIWNVLHIKRLCKLQIIAALSLDVYFN